MRYAALLNALLLTGGLLLGASAEARIKCWTNAEGNRECGDKVPPEYSRKGHEVRTEDGIVVDQVDAAASPEEIQRQLAEQEAAEKQRILDEEQRRMDQVLMQTFVDENDILRSQNDKVDILEGQITLANERIKKLKAQLEKFQGRISVYREKEQEIPASLVQGKTSAESQIVDQEKFIELRRTEQQEIINSHQAQLTRFRELTSGGGSPAPEPAAEASP